MRLKRQQEKPELSLETEAGGVELLRTVTPRKFFYAGQSCEEGGACSVNYSRRLMSALIGMAKGFMK